jgi:hypothetical protein
MKINLSTTTIDLSIMAILLGLKIAIWGRSYLYRPALRN